MKRSELLPFTKMQATGNDFVLIDNRNGAVRGRSPEELARRFSDRRFGIGSDGLILLEESGGELVMLYKNPDGSDAGMCGNGARCFARFARTLGYGDEIVFRVHDKRYRATGGDEQITIHFPLRTFVTPLRLDDTDLYQVYTNTEHVVCPVSEERLGMEKELVGLGRELRRHEVFAPSGTNVNFICGISPDTVRLQTYERGVEDLTLACGTGAIASAIAWHHLQKEAEGIFTMRVETKGGELQVGFRHDATTETYDEVTLTGSAETVFEGRIPL